ncbi:MAG: hypothetical protein FWH52_00995 [Synergistaceae bacterium]|nr:hypothetical protein [Synergistaceae bacterium]
MRRIVAFHIENSREDYARSFNFIMHGIDGENNWVSKHVKYLERSFISPVNEYRDAVFFYERDKKNACEFHNKPKEDDIFYFRVKNKQDNDIINIHYFFLASRYIDRKCCLAVIPEDLNTPVESSIISSYLLYESILSNNENRFHIIKEEFNDSRKHTAVYNIALSQTSNENIFLLRPFKDINTGVIYDLYPHRINKRKLTVSHRFFPQLPIQANDYELLGRAAEEKNRNQGGLHELTIQKWHNRNARGIIFYRDVLYSIALKGNYQEIDLRNKETIERICVSDKGERVERDGILDDNQENLQGIREFSLPVIDLIDDILSEYCKKCLEEIYGNIKKKSSDEVKVKINEMFNYLDKIAKTTSVLAYCLFLTFWSFLCKEREITYFDEDGILLSDSRDDLLIDAQDYADGILHLLENAARHSEEKSGINRKGILCLRIHHTKEDRHAANDSRDYLRNRYGIGGVNGGVNGEVNGEVNDKTDCEVNGGVDCETNGEVNGKDNKGIAKKKYFLEVLISDYNSEYDIPKRFVKNIEEDIGLADADYNYSREYDVDNELLASLKKFKLVDFFDYQKGAAKNDWRKFYSKPQNLISHYGLLVFKHLVDFAEGKFRLYSSNESRIISDNIFYNDQSNQPFLDQAFSETSEIHIPGTQYEILLPIGIKKHNPRTTGLNAELKIDETVLEWEAEFIPEEKFAFAQTDRNDRKEETITKVYNSIWSELKKLNGQKKFPCFNAANITTAPGAEIFVKALIKILATHKTDAPEYIAILCATDGFLSAFIRIFSLIYMKTGQNDAMAERQVYLCSPNAEKEILFYGNSLHASVEATFEISTLAKGQPLHEVKILMREEEKASDADYAVYAPEKIFPFDCFIPDLFHDRVKSDLEQDILGSPFGCCLEETHMRVGSKIHIHGNYYEASLLFGLSNYVSRFSYFLYKISSKVIRETIDREPAAKLVLIGYETYSENLVIAFKENIKRFSNLSDNQIDYIIYNEANRDDTFSRWGKVKPDKHSRFIVVVPIGSTLTTHVKIKSDLRCKMSNTYSADNENAFYQAVILHHCVVLIRDDQLPRKDAGKGRYGLEERFWEEINDCSSPRYVHYKNAHARISNQNLIYFFVSVSNEWFLPNECIHCFPPSDKFCKEQPLIQANRASVVPMIMYGKKDERRPEAYTEKFNESIRNFALLKEGLCYGHIVRDGDNHFEYYIKTDTVIDAIFRDADGKDKFDKWLNGITEESDTFETNGVVFNFIVAPLHDTNAAFVSAVKEKNRAKQIIWLDTKRDYRSNINAKYSNLRTLYDNLCGAFGARYARAEIRFHFVDDTIVTGASFYRAKSVLQSLFPVAAFHEKDDGVTVRLFQSVILLINRCSKNTQLNFVEEGHFHSFFELNISSMRNHNDACVMCKKAQNFAVDINMAAATNELSKISLKKAQKYKIINSEDITRPEDVVLNKYSRKFSGKKWSELVDEEKTRIGWLQGRAYYRLIATHRINNRFNALQNREVPTAVQKMIWEELNEICSCSHEQGREKRESFFAFLKVISKPFLSFKKSVIEAALPVVLEVAEYYFTGNSRLLEDNDKINIWNFVDKLKTPSRDEEGEYITSLTLLKVLFSCLTNMNSTYLLRVYTINNVLEYIKNMHQEVAEGFICNYAFCIKQILSLSRKENLGVWLEHLLIEKQELHIPGRKRIGYNRVKDKLLHASTLLNLLRLENTYLIRDALGECKKAFNLSHTWSDADASKRLLEEYESTNCELEKIVKSTLDQYFCDTYREFVAEMHESPVNSDILYNEFVPMLYLSLLLDKTHLSSLERENSFYHMMLELSAKILGTDTKYLGLFAVLNTDTPGEKNIYQLFPDPGKSADTIKDSRRFVSDIIKNHIIDEQLLRIGDTFFLIRDVPRGKSRYAAIKLLANEYDNPTIGSTEYYFAYQLRAIPENESPSGENSSETNFEQTMLWDNENKAIQSAIVKARNLLSMRSELVKRLVADYDNNIFDTYLEFRKSFEMLSSDKSRAHAPFEELGRAFSFMKETIDLAHKSNLLHSEYAYDLYTTVKTIADSIVSKWSIHSIRKTFPQRWSPKDATIMRNMDMTGYEVMLVSVLKSRIVVKGADVFPDKTSSIEIDFEKITLDTPKSFSYIWFCAFFEVFFNALRHGNPINSDEERQIHDKERQVHIEVSTSADGRAIKFRNMKLADEQLDDDGGITLPTLKYYFDNYYGKETFMYGPTNDGHYEVTMPIKIVEKERLDNEKSSNH